LKTGATPAVTHVIGKFCDVPLKEQLFESEWKTLQTLKEKYSELCGNYSDEFLVSCLFARKMDISRTHELLEYNLKWRKESGFMKIPTISEVDLQLMQYILAVPGARSKDGCGIFAVRMGKAVVGTEPITFPTMSKWAAWYNYVGIFCHGIDYLRSGVYFIQDLDGYSWKNFDLEHNKKMGNIWTNVFPIRIKKIFIVNPPSIVNAVIRLSRVFLKKKNCG